MLTELESDLAEITGFAGVSLQPNSGAQGEFAGLMVIRAYHASRGESHRDVCLIPNSAHGTNPASAVMAGMKVVVVGCDKHGNIDVNDLKEKAELHSERLGALMITYPSTHGVFESSVLDVTSMIHAHGGQVYMDGANMNAQVGLTSPGMIGADVCLEPPQNLRHSPRGGGPGVGPIGVAEHLVPFLPGHDVVPVGEGDSIDAVSSAPFGSALIAQIPYAYIKMLGQSGLTQSTKVAILNANYLKARLEGAYDVLYQAKNGTVAHEMILDCRAFKAAGIEVMDIAKRLIDYGFHAPTVSWPVPGTLMVEPTESESLEELDRFAEAMLSIREEIAAIERGEAHHEDNVLKMAPHPVEEATATEWDHPYTREQAVIRCPTCVNASSGVRWPVWTTPTVTEIWCVLARHCPRSKRCWLEHCTPCCWQPLLVSMAKAGERLIFALIFESESKTNRYEAFVHLGPRWPPELQRHGSIQPACRCRQTRHGPKEKGHCSGPERGPRSVLDRRHFQLRQLDLRQRCRRSRVALVRH